MKRKFRSCRMAATIWGALLMCISVPAIEVGWHPDMTIDLGDGVSMSQQQVPAFAGLVEMSPSGISINNGWQNEIVTFAQHTHDMVRTLKVNSSVSLRSLYSSGDMNVSFFSRQTFGANELKFVFTKTRNFGTTLFTPLRFSSLFMNQLPIFQRSLSGEALHSRIASTFGTHYVRGYESAAFVSVVYTFQYASASIKRSLSVSASGSVSDTASFSGFVNSFFKNSDSAVSMSYQFYSSDPNKPASFANNATIQNYEQFISFVNQLEEYGNSMTYANAKITGYVLDPIQSIPGYLSLLGGYVPLPGDANDASDFLRVYSALQIWNQRLGSQIGAMSWLNARGQQLLTQKALDIGNYLAAMDSIMSNHYATGAPLYLPADVVTYLANLSDIRLPEIYIMDTFVIAVDQAPDWRYIIGRIDCGDRDLMKDVPFSTITELYYGTNNGTLAQVYYDPVQFRQLATNNVSSATRYKDTTGTYDSAAINRFAKTLNSAQWACLTNPAINPNLNGFFLARQRYDYAWRWSLAVSDARGTNVDVMSFLDTRSGGCGCPDQISSDVALAASASPSGPGVIGFAQPVTIEVTNQSSVQSYRTTVSFVLSSAFDFAGASGSQGYASFNPSNRLVTCAFGPLLGGANASMNLLLIPLQPNAVPGTTATLTLGEGLTNSSPATIASFYPVESALPTLNVTRGPSGALIDWWSESDRLLIERSVGLGSSASWSPMTNGVVRNGSYRFLPTQISGPQAYFRVRAQ